MTGEPAVVRSETVEEFDTSCAVASRLIRNKNMVKRYEKRRGA